MRSSLDDYFAALDRLRARKAKINNDTVAIEAGRKKGSIKKSRPQFAALISAIEQANQEMQLVNDDGAMRLEELKGKIEELRLRYEAAISREISLLRQVRELKTELVNLRGGSVVPIRSR
ncbi:hypothetical protein SAMN05443245_4685 [Paraburkholderia fungorum]|uniref:Uncharacterized protein n=1 Tax=Paraburkholderia fungorum TaxID=134537 RepID=A0A1H1I577_9BURK|nr:hypothetical protein [Paraburkholderia fungorum]SDR32864.1 hypothetical protein SAMN05443245_4685 [Paraburkholderia fungorum]